jgi:hypothetical protein
MKTAILKGTVVALVCGLLLAWAWAMLLVPAVQAQNGGPGHLAPGAGAMASPHFAVQGTLAGALAGDAQSDNFAVRGGIWGWSSTYQVYLPLVLRAGR